MKHNPELIKRSIAKCSIEDLKKIDTACGKNHKAVFECGSFKALRGAIKHRRL